MHNLEHKYVHETYKSTYKNVQKNVNIKSPMGKKSHKNSGSERRLPWWPCRRNGVRIGHTIAKRAGGRCRWRWCVECRGDPAAPKAQSEMGFQRHCWMDSTKMTQRRCPANWRVTNYTAIWFGDPSYLPSLVWFVIHHGQKLCSLGKNYGRQKLWETTSIFPHFFLSFCLAGKCFLHPFGEPLLRLSNFTLKKTG